MRLIDADALKESFCKSCDAVQVVRCKDCEYYMNDARSCWNELINADMIIEPNWYCANAVRKDYD